MKKIGVFGIGRIFFYSYNMRSGSIISYSLFEGEIERGELHGFGRMINCYNKSHELILGFWHEGELQEERPWKRDQYGIEEEDDMQDGKTVAKGEKKLL